MWVLWSQGDDARGAQVPVGKGMGNLHGLLLAQRGPTTLNPVATGPAPANFSSRLCFYLQDVERHPGLSGFAQSLQSDVASSLTIQSSSTEPLQSPPTSGSGEPQKGVGYKSSPPPGSLGSLSIHHIRAGPLPECYPHLASMRSGISPACILPHLGLGLTLVPEVE